MLHGFRLNLSLFWPLLKYEAFFEATGEIMKIGLSRKPNHHKWIFQVNLVPIFEMHPTRGWGTFKNSISLSFWSCLPQNELGVTYLLFSFLVPPKWVHEPHDVQGLVGQDIVLPCLVEGYPDPVTVWTRSNGKNVEQCLSLNTCKMFFFLTHSFNLVLFKI